jgi:pyruvate/2-oxoglutarate dehydrogenase complex dihydrolipoamide dehydrogenase (E3) component
VPSKTLIAAGRAAYAIRRAEQFGITSSAPSIDRAALWRRIRSVQEEIAASDDDPSRYRAMGIELITGEASLTGPHEVTVNGQAIETRFTLVCTGSRPAVPVVPGLAQEGMLTSDTFWDAPPSASSLIFLGGGPISVELAQACQRLGIQSTVLQLGSAILAQEEPVLVEQLTAILRSEGVQVELGVTAEHVDPRAHGVIVQGTQLGERRRWEADGLFVATGRLPNVEGLGLDALGIDTGPAGIVVDERGRTSVRSIYAAGDVAGRRHFTHSAAYEGVRAVRDMFFPGPGAVSELMPWCTFTDPELAHVGLTIAEAEDRFGDQVDVWRLDLGHSDRARCEGTTDGAVILVTGKQKLVGAHILAPGAGEMIHEPALAIAQGLRLSELAGLVHVYPTLSTAIGQLAAESAFERSRKLRWLVKKGRT